CASWTSCLSALLLVSRCSSHLTLVSFPTRRSSHLRPVRPSIGITTDSVSSVSAAPSPPSTFTLPRYAPASRGICWQYLTVVPSGDRKSTRLHSSHVKTSYAVFCLKNKILFFILFGC